MAADRIRVFEVGPRDGLQNEPRKLSLENKIWFVNSLVKAGVRDIELGSFVRADRVPQMVDTDRLVSALRSRQLKLRPATGWCLVPNERGLERALRVGATNIAVFTAATESFNRKNLGMTIAESLAKIAQVLKLARNEVGSALRVRGYVSTAFGCPFEGRVAPKKALHVIERLARLGVEEVSIGDTIGVATPADVKALIKPALKILGVARTAAHFHDTRGTALANALRSMDLGVRVIDSSAGGFGGCPFAPGAAGNLATEDLVYMLNGMGLESGIRLDRLCETTLELSRRMKRPLTSRYLQAYASHQASGIRRQAASVSVMNRSRRVD